jgi:outer membrane lipoprotein SlyB
VRRGHVETGTFGLPTIRIHGYFVARSLVRNMHTRWSMSTARTVALLTLPALLLGGCATTTYQTTSWGGEQPYAQEWARYGHVESVRETIRTTQGDPGAGAFAGALIGGLLFGGRNPVQTMAGMAGGAMVGAAASQSASAQDRFYEVFVRFDDGGLEPYTYQNVLPFRVGDRVALSAQGLSRL